MSLEKDIELVLSFEKTKQKWRAKFDSKEFILANEVSIVIMKDPLQRKKKCGCIEDLFIMLKSLTKNKIKLKTNQMESKFKLKAGILIQVHGVDHLSEHNVTDKSAKALLKKYPSHIVSFESYPSDWEALVFGKKKAAKIEKVEKEVAIKSKK